MAVITVDTYKTRGTQRCHRMPFGAQMIEQGKVRFRLWAPALSQVMLRLDEYPPRAMEALADGWFELVSDDARAGSRYCYQISEELCVPDPASRFNPDDVHGASSVINAGSFIWQDEEWYGRPWHEAVIYEVHVGAFTPEGTFAALEKKLDYLVELGITALELMPVAQFPGHRDWGYDGTLLFAPHNDYGSPDDLKRLVQSAHQRGLMVLLDVVYNHFGPEGNYLHHYAPQFFTEHHHTLWGAAINFDGEDSRTVRDFYIHNALYWLEEYHFDGLRLDAVHAVIDDSRPDILQELAQAVQAMLGRGRQIHLVLENDQNAAHYLERDGEGHSRYYDAQWNDDLHHACHVLLTGEQDGYYVDYQDQTTALLGRSLSEGFAYQGEASCYRQGAARGEASRHLPPTAFVAFLQNHDQIGNRAFGERLGSLVAPEALAAATALLLLAPQPPLLFMGEEWGAGEPFAFFCDFEPGLAKAVTEGRRKEFADFEHFRDPGVRESIADPCAEQTFRRAQLNWRAQGTLPHSQILALYRQLLALRRRAITPRLHGARSTGYQVLAPGALSCGWLLGDGEALKVIVNLGRTQVQLSSPLSGDVLYYSSASLAASLAEGVLPASSVVWYLENDHGLD